MTRTEHTEPLCLYDLRHISVAEKHGGDKVMVAIANRLNTKLHLLGIEITWINVPDAVSNPDGMIGHFTIAVIPALTDWQSIETAPKRRHVDTPL